MSPDDLPTAERKQLAEDASFYQIQGLVEVLSGGSKQEVQAATTAKWRSGPNYNLSSNDRIATKSGVATWDATVVAELVDTSGIVKWGVTVKNTQNSDIMVGVAPATINQSSLSNYTTGGWYVYLKSGALYSRDALGVVSEGRTKIGVGSTIFVTLNKKKREIIFNMNGTEFVAYSYIPTTIPLVASVCLYHPQDSVELVM